MTLPDTDSSNDASFPICAQLFSRRFGREKASTNLGKEEARRRGAPSTGGWGTSYDDVGRLVQVDEGGSTVEAYSYDANGNRLTSTNSAGTSAATYDDQDRIQMYGSIEYTFTLNGELLNKTDTATDESTDYVYDAVGNLREVTLPNGDAIEYLVDGQGRRVGKRVNGVLEKAWLWRGALQPVAELDGAGNVVARFVYAEGVNVPELIVTAAATYRLVKDHLGSVREVLDLATGVAVQEIVYNAWGRVVVDTNPGFQPFGFAGGLYDPDTGLVRFGARDYDAQSGRWTAKDPLRFEAGTNHYEYVGSQPTTLTDPSGRLAWLIPFVPAIVDVAVAAGTAAAATAAAYYGGRVADQVIGGGIGPFPPWGGPGPGGGIGDFGAGAAAGWAAAAAATAAASSPYRDPGECVPDVDPCDELRPACQFVCSSAFERGTPEWGQCYWACVTPWGC